MKQKEDTQRRQWRKKHEIEKKKEKHWDTERKNGEKRENKKRRKEKRDEQQGERNKWSKRKVMKEKVKNDERKMKRKGTEQKQREDFWSDFWWEIEEKKTINKEFQKKKITHNFFLEETKRREKGKKKSRTFKKRRCPAHLLKNNFCYDISRKKE